MKTEFENAIRLGIESLENSGDIARTEEIIKRICLAHGAQEVHIFIIPYLIVVTIIYDNQEKTVFRRISWNELNLGRLEEINNISRAICNNTRNTRKIDYSYSPLFTSICVMAAVAAFCTFFGGTWRDAIFSAIAGLIMSNLPYQKHSLNLFSRTLIESTISGFIAYIPSFFGFDTHPDKIMIGTIMLLIPGMSVGISMREMMSGNIIAGIFELSEAVIIALAINLGFGISIMIFGSELFV